MSLFLRLFIVAVIVILDQVTKLLIDNRLEMYERIPVTGFFNITKAYNSGAAFSFLSDADGWQRPLLTGISLVVSIALLIWLVRMSREERWLSLAIALILSGAVGNLIDRALYGHVVDFIQVHWWGQAYFPSFNVADSAITCGAALLIVISLFERTPEAESE
ncbi:MAG: signal peptidase II [Gammaproteobacteria bacterium]|nr:MAG: signal peptidase II [Gammaproteobacteria bacterium]